MTETELGLESPLERLWAKACLSIMAALKVTALADIKGMPQALALAKALGMAATRATLMVATKVSVRLVVGLHLRRHGIHQLIAAGPLGALQARVVVGRCRRCQAQQLGAALLHQLLGRNQQLGAVLRLPMVAAVAPLGEDAAALMDRQVHAVTALALAGPLSEMQEVGVDDRANIYSSGLFFVLSLIHI